MTEYLQARQSEPCCRGALKNTHNAFTFLEEAAAVEDRLTQRALYGTVYKEILATATPGREPRQAPRIPVVILEGLDQRVLSENIRVVGPVAMLGNIALLGPQGSQPRPRFCCPRKQTCSKAYALENHWRGQETKVPNGYSHGVMFRLAAELGFSALESARDYLLPNPASNYKGCIQKELRHETGSTMQAKLFSGLKVAGERIFQHRVASFWTPHSARNFLPSAASSASFITWGLATCYQASIFSSTCTWERRCHIVTTLSRFVHGAPKQAPKLTTMGQVAQTRLLLGTLRVKTEAAFSAAESEKVAAEAFMLSG